MITDLDDIKVLGDKRQEENDDFAAFVKGNPDDDLDELVHRINDAVSAQIDCTACGNCCQSLMINVTTEESEKLADFLQLSVEATKAKYIEESLQGRMIINTIPCHFLTDKRCTIYPERFTECRDFPHLHKPGFSKRLFNTLSYYGMCPIIFNVVEAVKISTGFKANV